MPTVAQHRTQLRTDLQTDNMVVRIGKFKTPIEVKIWKDPDPVFQLSQRDEGKQVAIASEPWNFTVYLKEYNDEEQYVILKVMDKNSDRGVNSRRTLYPQEVILHPDELTLERLERYGHEVYDGRSV